MNIALDKDVEEFVQKQIRSGARPEELVNDVLRSLSRQQHLLETSPELESWLLEAADEPATPLTRGDFTSIRERVRARNNL